MIKRKRLIALISGMVLAISCFSFGALQVINGPVSNVTRTSCDVYGVVTSNSYGSASATLYYGTSDHSSNSHWWGFSSSYGSVTGLGTIAKSLSGLTPAQRYYYRWYLSQNGVSTWAPTTSIFTTSASAPTNAPSPTNMSVTAYLNGILAAPINFFVTNGVVTGAVYAAQYGITKSNGIAYLGTNGFGGIGTNDLAQWATYPSVTNIIPANGNEYDIGSSNTPFRYGYFSNLVVREALTNIVVPNLAAVLTAGNDAAGQSATNFNYLHQTNQAILFELKNNENIGLESTGYPISNQLYGTWAGVGALYKSSNTVDWPYGVGKYNVAIGHDALYMANGSYNVAVGDSSMYKSIGGDNAVFGRWAYENGNCDSLNTILGSYAAYDLQGDGINIAVGFGAANTSTQDLSIAVGFDALAESVGSMAIGIGYDAGAGDSPLYSLGGFAGIYIGQWAGYEAKGELNTVVGDYAFGDSEGGRNTAVGPWAGELINGYANVAVGLGALSTWESYDRDANVAVGAYAMAYSYKGNGNVAVGEESLWKSVGDYNVAVGRQAGNSANGTGWGSSNVLLGANSGLSSFNINGVTNTICLGAGSPTLGDNSMVLGNSGITNTFIYGNISVTGSIIPVVSYQYDIGSSNTPFRYGYFSIVAASGGFYHAENRIPTNVVINGSLGSVTGNLVYLSVSGSQNLASVLTNGNDAAGQSATNFNYLHQTNQAVLFELKDNENIGLESTAYPVTLQKYGTWAGVGALCNNTNTGWPPGGPSEYNTAFGYQSLYNSIGGYNIAVGSRSLMTIDGTDNVGIGVEAFINGVGDLNTIVGSWSANFLSGALNIGVGFGPLNESLTDLSIAMGFNALEVSKGDMNIGIGYEAFSGDTEYIWDWETGELIRIDTNFCLGDLSVYIGNWSGKEGRGDNNTALGSYSFDESVGDENTAIGYSSLESYLGSASVAVGAFSLSSPSSASNLTENTAIGYLSMGGFIYSNYNSAVGAQSLMFVDGAYNTALGYKASEGGNFDYWGNSNVMIGANSGRIHPYSMINNSISLGADSPSLGDNSMVLGNNGITNTFIYGNIAVTGSIIPVVSNQYDIGSSNMPFRHGYFGTNSLYVGDMKITKSKIEYWDSKVDSSNAVVSELTIAEGGSLNGSYVPPTNIFTSTLRSIYKSWSFCDSSADGSVIVFCVFGGQLYVSTDTGVTWTARDSNRGWRDCASSDNGTKLVAVVEGGQIYTSTDAGTNWTARDSNRSWKSCASSADGTKLVAVVRNGQIYTSTDAGTNWTARDSSRTWASCASSADGTKLVAGVDGGQIYTSTDAGTNWTARDSSRRWYSLASSADGTKLVAGDPDTQEMYGSVDAGTNWTLRTSGQVWVSLDSSFDGTRLIASAYGGYLFTSSDSGITWVERGQPREWQGSSISSNGTKLVAGDGGPGAIYTMTLDYIDPVQSSINGFANSLWDFASSWVTNNSTNVVLLKNGNVGIGTDSPSERLHVVGDTTNTGSITADGGFYTGSHILPTASNQYDIGSSNMPFRHGYFGSNSVYLGDYQVSKAKAESWDAGGTNGNNAFYQTNFPPNVVQTNDNYYLTVQRTNGTSGKVWTSRTTPNSGWRDVCWSPERGIFVAAGAVGTGIMTSPDGITWTSQNPPVTNSWGGVCWSPQLGIFVVVGLNGSGNRIMTSTNGIDWVSRTSPADSSWCSVCWSPELNLFVAVAFTGTLSQRIMTSSDGVTWNLQNAPAQMGTLSDVCWSPERSLFVGVAVNGSNGRVMTSVNGTSWQLQNVGTGNSWQSVCWSPQLERFVAVAYNGSQRVMTSTDGFSWASHDAAVDLSWYSVCWSPDAGVFCAVAYSGSGNRVMTSTDGTNWTSRASASDEGWFGLAWSPSVYRFVAVAASGSESKAVMTSDGETSAVLESSMTAGGGFYTGSHILPTASNQYDIGSSNMPFRHGYFGSNSLYLAQYRLGVSSNGSLTYNDYPVVSTGGVSVAVDTNMQAQIDSTTQRVSVLEQGTSTWNTVTEKISTNGSAFYLTNFPVNVVQTNNPQFFNSITTGQHNVTLGSNVAINGSAVVHGSLYVDDTIYVTNMFVTNVFTTYTQLLVRGSATIDGNLYNTNFLIASNGLLYSGGNQVITNPVAGQTTSTMTSNWTEAYSWVNSNSNSVASTNYVAGIISGSGKLWMTDNGSTSILYHVTSGGRTNKIGEFFSVP